MPDPRCATELAPDSRVWRVDAKAPPCPTCGAKMIYARSGAGYVYQCVNSTHYYNFEQWLSKCRRKFLQIVKVRENEELAVRVFNQMAASKMLPWRIKGHEEKVCLRAALYRFHNEMNKENP